MCAVCVQCGWRVYASATGYVPDTLKYGIRYGTDYGAFPCHPYMCGFVFRDAGGPVTRALGFFVLSSTVAVKRVGCTRRTFTSLHFASKALGQYILVVSQRAKWRASVP